MHAGQHEHAPNKRFSRDKRLHVPHACGLQHGAAHAAHTSHAAHADEPLSDGWHGESPRF